MLTVGSFEVLYLPTRIATARRIPTLVTFHSVRIVVKLARLFYQERIFNLHIVVASIVFHATTD